MFHEQDALNDMVGVVGVRVRDAMTKMHIALPALKSLEDHLVSTPTLYPDKIFMLLYMAAVVPEVKALLREANAGDAPLNAIVDRFTSMDQATGLMYAFVVGAPWKWAETSGPRTLDGSPTEDPLLRFVRPRKDHGAMSNARWFSKMWSLSGNQDTAFDYLFTKRAKAGGGHGPPPSMFATGEDDSDFSLSDDSEDEDARREVALEVYGDGTLDPSPGLGPCAPAPALHDVVRLMSTHRPVKSIQDILHRHRFREEQCPRIPANMTDTMFKTRITEPCIFPGVHSFVASFVSIVWKTVPGIHLPLPCGPCGPSLPS